MESTRLTTPAKVEVIADYERIGELTGHTTRAIVVDPNLAHPIMYWGWMVAHSWELDYNEILPPWIDPDEQDYLIVVGNDQLDHVGLRTFAHNRPVVATTDRYDLRPSGRTGAGGVTVDVEINALATADSA